MKEVHTPLTAGMILDHSRNKTEVPASLYLSRVLIHLLRRARSENLLKDILLIAERSHESQFPWIVKLVQAKG
jgi:hypothetical protein